MRSGLEVISPTSRQHSSACTWRLCGRHEPRPDRESPSAPVESMEASTECPCCRLPRPYNKLYETKLIVSLRSQTCDAPECRAAAEKAARVHDRYASTIRR